MITLRPASMDDRDAIAKLHAENYANTYRGVFPDQFLDGQAEPKMRAHWRSVNPGPDDLLLVATEGDQLIGFIAVWCEPKPFIDNLHVRQTSRGLGIGTKLMAQAARSLIEKGYSTAYLWAITTNQKAIDYYTGLGGQLGEVVTERLYGEEAKSQKIVWPDLNDLLGRIAAPAQTTK